MLGMHRRSFIEFALAALPLTVFGQSLKTKAAGTPVHLRTGEDRFAKTRTLGFSLTTYKVSTQDSGGGLFVMEHKNQKKGGPPLHLHHDVDEWFYVIEGDYIMRVGTEQYPVKAGDSVFGPREIPHTWSFVGNTPGKMLFSYAPAGKMEAFFDERDRRGGAAATNAELLRAYGMEMLGPPLAID
jgi:mannose-6-phosphate isomerase-like protein (cupin superfamily)